MITDTDLNFFLLNGFVSLPSLIDDETLQELRRTCFFYSYLLYKPPGHPHETPWHQDDADEDNGCMHFHPSSEHDTLLPRCVKAGDPEDENRLLGLIDPGLHIDNSKIVPCPIKAGGATIHDSGTLHFTTANHSDRPRRAYIFNFADPDMVKRCKVSTS